MKLAPVEVGRKPSAKVRDGALAPPQIVSLSNGRYSVRLSEAGSGFARLEDFAVTRWSGDEVAEVDGFHLYLRDLDDGYSWSAGYQPMRGKPARYEFRADECRRKIYASSSRVSHLSGRSLPTC